MSKYLAPALDKGLDILEYLSNVAIPQSQTEISLGIGKSQNELYRMLICLEQRGYLLKSSTGQYSLSLKLYQLSHRHSPIDGLLKIAKPFMEQLSNKTKQSCHMSILYHGQLMVVSQTRSPGPVTLSIEEGSLFPLIKTTSGRVLLAFSDENRQQQLLIENKDFQNLSTKEKEEFKNRLQDIREKKYELALSDITAGVTDIAVPIGSIETGVFCSLAISSLSKISKETNDGDSFINEIKKTAIQINNILIA